MAVTTPQAVAWNVDCVEPPEEVVQEYDFVGSEPSSGFVHLRRTHEARRRRVRLRWSEGDAYRAARAVEQIYIETNGGVRPITYTTVRGETITVEFRDPDFVNALEDYRAGSFNVELREVF